MSNIVETNIVLDLNRSAIQTIYAKQYDNDTRSIKIEVVNQGNHVNINELGYVVYFKGKASNGRNVLQHCTVDENDIVSIELTANILHVAGHLNGELLLVDSHSGTWDETNITFSDGAVVSTMPFILHVKASTFEDEEVPEEEVSLLNDLIAEVASITTDIGELEEYVEDNERTRVSNENTRIENETIRVSNEATRVTNETSRVTNESIRQSNESTRQSNEATRQTNETGRQTTMAQIEQDLATLENELDDVVLKTQLGVATSGSTVGVATLDTNAKVPESQLPSYVDDVLEGEAQNVTQSVSGSYTATAFILTGETTPCTPEEGKIYIDITDLIQYRWSGSIYVSVGSHLALGETSSTAFPGNRGKTIEDNYQSKTGNVENNIATFTESATRINLISGETLSSIFGKIKKFFADLKTVAFTGSYNDLINKPEHLGHSIKDSTTTFTDRAGLKFTGNVSVTDDLVNDETVVEVEGSPYFTYASEAAMEADLSNRNEGDDLYIPEDGTIITTDARNVIWNIDNQTSKSVANALTDINEEAYQLRLSKTYTDTTMTFNEMFADFNTLIPWNDIDIRQKSAMVIVISNSFYRMGQNKIFTMLTSNSADYAIMTILNLSGSTPSFMRTVTTANGNTLTNLGDTAIGSTRVVYLYY